LFAPLLKKFFTGFLFGVVFGVVLLFGGFFRVF